MNKKEVIKGIQDEEVLGFTTYEDEAYNEGLKDALDYVEQLDEPEKVVLTKEEAEWLEKLKEYREKNKYHNKYDTLYYIARAGFSNLFSFYGDNGEVELAEYKDFNDTKERLTKALLYGYTVKKEKLYTARLKSTGEYLHYDTETDKVHHFCAYGDTAKNSKHYHFTKDTLLKYNAWENDFYDVNEVKE